MKIKIFSWSLAVLTLASCKKSFIELTPQTRVTEANYFQTVSDYQQAVTAAYSPLQGLTNDAYVMGEMRSDNANYIYLPSLQGGQFTDKYNITQFLDVPINMNNSNKYVQCYSGISKTNAVLVRIDAANIDDSDKNNIKGQAEFLRAYYYYELVQYYGGVPLHLAEVSSVSQTALARSSDTAVYNQIIKDATDAANILPVVQTQLGMVTKGSAEALLGHVYMSLKQYSNAEAALTTVTTLGYSLLPSYASVFDPANKNNAESIFEVQYQEGSNGLQSNFAYQFAPAVTNTITITGVAGNNQTIGGWNTPSFDLLAAYEPGDLRKAATIDSGYTDPTSGNFVAQPFCKKYLHPPYAVFNNTGDDWIVYRYADVLLLLAECLNEESKTSQALPMLNQVRARAGLAATSASSQTDVRSAIARERRVELAFENHRWLDLVRTGQAIPVMTAYGAKMKQMYSYIQPDAYNVTSDRLVFPIPQSEIDINSLLVQNPGY
jgi:starch-binding outer membrane protein, SusD/RagB family